MISKSLSTSKRFADVATLAGSLGEFCQALFPLLVSHADDFGRLEGDPFTVKHLCHPTSSRPVQEFQLALEFLARSGLIHVYETAEHGQIIQIAGFDAHQTGLHKRTDSRFPGNSRKFPEIPTRREGKGTEGNRTEENRNEPPSARLSVSYGDDGFQDPVITERAGRFVERYAELYPEHRHGARYAVKPARDYAAAVTLCQTWVDDARLEKLAICFLTTDHKFAAEGSRTIPQFLALASWADGELAAWEKGRASA